jgi:hypothetical protein
MTQRIPDYLGGQTPVAALVCVSLSVAGPRFVVMGTGVVQHSGTGRWGGATLHQVRSACLGLPETFEEPAWVGTRWRVRSRTFAHLLTVVGGWPKAYSRAASSDGPATVLTFRSAGAELGALRAAGRPFFATPWRPDEVGLVLDGSVGWTEVAELLAESYRVQAPTSLTRLLDAS